MSMMQERLAAESADMSRSRKKNGETEKWCVYYQKKERRSETKYKDGGFAHSNAVFFDTVKDGRPEMKRISKQSKNKQ